jgi:hypothetical protein
MQSTPSPFRKSLIGTIRVVSVLTLLLTLGGIAGRQAAAQPSPPPTPTSTDAALQTNPADNGLVALPPIDLFPVPIALKRRAAQFLEEMRDSPLAPGWEDARLSAIVRPLYRPDLGEIAYYEFPVMLPAVQLPGQPQTLTAAGFIIVSTGKHDYPIAHWSHTGPSPVQEMTAQAQAAGAVPTKFFKLDTLAYAAENAEGQRVAKLGSDPVNITEVDQQALEALPAVIETSWDPTQPAQLSGDTPAPGMLRVNGEIIIPPFRLIPWESWDDLKLKFGSTYLKLLDAVRANATREWDVEQMAAEHGMILSPGDTYILALISPITTSAAPQVTLTGPGAAIVETELVESPGRSPALRITASNGKLDQDMPFEVQVTYADNEQETVKFMVASTPFQVFLPGITGPLGAATTAAAPEPQQTTPLANGWGNWVIYSAGSPSDQPAYTQIKSGEFPNNDICLSGCGATAWAMLFGWADIQAGNNRYPWTAHYGLYRQYGGRGPYDAIAPIFMDAGVKNMMWEIRSAIGTFCGFGSEAATTPWDMEYAREYIAGRDTMALTTHYNVAGQPEARIAQAAINSIVQRKTPVIIGTGTLGHYPMAFQYAWRSRRVWVCNQTCGYRTEYQQLFFVNQGWGGSGNSWIPVDTWFAGQIWP